MKRYLLWFANEHLQFRIPEIEAIADLYSLEFKWVNRDSKDPYAVVDARSQYEVLKLGTRSVILRGIYELWARAKTLDQLHEKLKHTLSTADVKAQLKSSKSFRIAVETYGKSISFDEKLNRIQSFNYIPVQCEVDLKDPDLRLSLFEYYGQNPNKVPDHPVDLFFGRWLSDGSRALITRYSLKQRKFIGNTSMDAQLSFLMANQAQVKEGDVVVDPFVGSGSLLVAAAAFGAFVFGTDIDYKVVHGTSKPTRFNKKIRDVDESIESNLKQYGLGDQYLDLMVADAASPPWKEGTKFDAIITDPPYGIRESTNRIGSSKSGREPIPKEHLIDHVPSKVEYCPLDIYADLLQFAAKHLVIEGRLVFWMPVNRAEYCEDAVPRHTCLSLVANSEQILTTHSSRRLITLVKMFEPTDEDEIVIHRSTKNFRSTYFAARGRGKK